MTMYRRILAVAAVVLVVAGVGGFFMLKESAPGPLIWADRAQVTGYATSTMKGYTSGAVSVDLDGASAARIDAIVKGLPRANLRYICAENAQEYHITFSADAGAGVRKGFALTGYWCNNLVVETLSHGTTMDRIDRDCALLAAVRRLLPARATATHAGVCAHANGRLFLAASRHATRTHKAAKHRAPARKSSPTSKSPMHKPPQRKSPVHIPARPKSPRRVAEPKHGRVKRGPVEQATAKGEALMHGTPTQGIPIGETLKRATPVRVMSAHRTPRRETRDVKKVVTAPTLW
jgi:hypothetical protein